MDGEAQHVLTFPKRQEVICGIGGEEKEDGEQGHERPGEKQEATDNTRHGGAFGQEEEVESKSRGGKAGGVQGGEVGGGKSGDLVESVEQTGDGRHQGEKQDGRGVTVGWTEQHPPVREDCEDDEGGGDGGNAAVEDARLLRLGKSLGGLSQDGQDARGAVHQRSRGNRAQDNGG